MKNLKSYLYRMGFLGSEFSKNSVRYLIDMYMTVLAQKEVVCIKFAKTNKRKKLEKELCMIKTINFSVYSPVIIHKLFFCPQCCAGSGGDSAGRWAELFLSKTTNKATDSFTIVPLAFECPLARSHFISACSAQLAQLPAHLFIPLIMGP